MNKKIVIMLFIGLLGAQVCLPIGAEKTWRWNSIGLDDMKVTLSSEQEIRHDIRSAGAVDFAEKSYFPLIFANRKLGAGRIIYKLVMAIQEYIDDTLYNDGPAMAKIRTAHLWAVKKDIAWMLLKNGGSNATVAMQKYDGLLNAIVRKS